MRFAASWGDEDYGIIMGILIIFYVTLLNPSLANVLRRVRVRLLL